MIPWWGNPEQPPVTNDALVQAVDRIAYLLTVLNGRSIRMAGELDGLVAQVQNTIGVEKSALVLIQDLHDRLVAAGTDPAKLAQLASDLKTSADALAASVAANPAP